MNHEPRRAFVTGVTGQDGSYLAELLIGKGYEVHGLMRRSSTFGTRRIEHLCGDDATGRRPLRLHDGDMSDANCLVRLIREIQPHEVYNLAAQSQVRVSFDQPTYTADVTAIGAQAARGGPRPPGLRGQTGAVLPGIEFRNVRRGGRDTAA